jgi:hypothetical protein
VLTIAFGDTLSETPIGIARFAAKQKPVQLVPGSFDLVAPRSANTPPASQRNALVKYDVTDRGTVPPQSIEILESSDRDLSNAIRDGLLRARFRPAESNCRAITMTVVQRFGR